MMDRPAGLVGANISCRGGSAIMASVDVIWREMNNKKRIIYLLTAVGYISEIELITFLSICTYYYSE
jgi:hypothetical protein